jgi:phosphoribosylanthranilate isomerase
MKLKVCGARTPQDVRLLAESGADMVGLWFAVPNGHAELDLEQLASLAEVARDSGITPMLVTFTNDVPLLKHAVERTGVRWLQLHAYQPPPVVRGLRGSVSGELHIVKVVHMRDGRCLEQPFLSSYERAGTDYFLLDKVSSDGRIGSTGQRIDGTEVIQLADSLNRPFLLAGGISATNRTDYDSVVGHELFYGIDVDSSARNAEGLFESATVTELSRTWGSTRFRERATA